MRIPTPWGFLKGNARLPLGLLLNGDPRAGGSKGRAPTVSVGGGQAVLVGTRSLQPQQRLPGLGTHALGVCILPFFHQHHL